MLETRASDRDLVGQRRRLVPVKPPLHAKHPCFASLESESLCWADRLLASGFSFDVPAGPTTKNSRTPGGHAIRTEICWRDLLSFRRKHHAMPLTFVYDNYPGRIFNLGDGFTASSSPTSCSAASRVLAKILPLFGIRKG